MLKPKAPPARNGPNTGSLADGVRRVNKKIIIINRVWLSITLKNLLAGHETKNEQKMIQS